MNKLAKLRGTGEHQVVQVMKTNNEQLEMQINKSAKLSNTDKH